MRFRLAAIAFLLGSVMTSVLGQGFFRGKVFDSKTMEPLTGVYLILGKNQGQTTDASGNFFIKSDTGKLNITFRFIGYKTISRTIIIKRADTLNLDIPMDMEIKEIGQIVISADRAEEKVAELTVSLDILKSGDFMKSHINDPQELITRTTGIEILDGQASVRGGSGFAYGTGSRVLALIDGLPVMSPDAGSIKWQFLPLENISQVEIIKGASSVLYGSSALNGVINFRTADASDTPVTKYFAETGIYGKPRNRNWVWWDTPRIVSSLSFSRLQKAGNNDIGFSFSLLGDNGYRKYNDEKLGRISLKLKHHSEKVKGLAYGLNVNSGYTSKTDFILWEDATTGALKQDTSTVSELHGSFIAIDPFISFSNSGKFRHDLRIRLQSAVNKFPVRTQNNSDARSIYAEYQTNYRISDVFSVSAGLAGTYSSVLSNFFGDHNGSNTALFAQLEAVPVARLKIIAGLRVEQNSLDKQKDKIAPVFRTGINWHAAEYTFLRFSFGQGYRYPSIAEKYASTSLGAVTIFPNPYVEPETGWSTEAGVKQGIAIGEVTGQADLSAFFSQNTNLIEYPFGNYPDPVTGSSGLGFRAENIENARVYGYELEFTLNRKFGDFSTVLSGGYTYIYPVEFNSATGKNTDTWLKYRRKHSANVSLDGRYRKISGGLSFFAKSKMLSIDDVFLNELTREDILPGFYDYWTTHDKGYFMMDCNLGYMFSKYAGLSFVVKNLTNTEYMGRPGDIQPQRNFSIRLSGSF